MNTHLSDGFIVASFIHNNPQKVLEINPPFRANVRFHKHLPQCLLIKLCAHDELQVSR